MAENTCTATTRTGSPCRRLKVHGSQLCQAHGGAKHKPNDIIAKALDGLEKPRCRYTKRNGEQCRMSPIKGGTVCRKHGGAAAHIQRKAQERLQAMINPALVELNKILSNDRTSDGDKLRAIGMVLDRTGFGKGMTVEHTQTKPWEVTMQHIITETPVEIYTDDIEDAEVVDESMPPIEDQSPRAHFTGPRIVPDNTGRARVEVGYVPVNSTVERPSRGRDRHDD